MLLLLLNHFSRVRLLINYMIKHIAIFFQFSLSPPGSAIPGILQARTLEWVTISFSNA